MTATAAHLDLDMIRAAASRIAGQIERTPCRRSRTLSEITGEFSADDLLGVIFSRFCIGK